MSRIPGLTTLSKIRGLDEVEIKGRGPDLAAQMKDVMEKTVSKKRSALVDD